MALLEDIERCCRRLLSEQNRDASTPTYGCFDRRYWSWKLVDFPEATFQRNVYALAWMLQRMPSGDLRRQVYSQAVIAGLLYSGHIQHDDGSFDQAFPNDRSFGATAFLLDPMIASFRIVEDVLDASARQAIEACLRAAADFLCTHEETHGHIANHLAGAVWSLVQACDLFGEQRYRARALELLGRILEKQSPEGWFTEYDGADPGYQTLCVQYLAQVAGSLKHEALDKALERAVSFLSWCIHPDGTFGGEYGSRRTAVYYPGGIALLSKDNPTAATMSTFMLDSIARGSSVGLADVDMGNMAPMAGSVMLAVGTFEKSPNEPTDRVLPWQREQAEAHFPGAGFHMWANGRFYSIFGSSNGGVLKVFDRVTGRLILNDGGYIGTTPEGRQITTQVTDRSIECCVSGTSVEIETAFFELSHPMPAPLQFIVLRVLNVSLMRSIRLGNFVKALLVKLLIRRRDPVAVRLTRRVTFAPDAIRVSDRVMAKGKLALATLECGKPFVGVHMASSRYFPGFAASGQPDGKAMDVRRLAADGVADLEFEVG